MILEKVGQIVKIKGENNVLGLKDYFKKLGLVGQSNWTNLFKKFGNYVEKGIRNQLISQN